MAHSAAAETAESFAPSEFESCAVPLLMTTIPLLPKELARLMAQYARPGGRVTTIAGIPSKQGGYLDGQAVGQALFKAPTAVALDTTDMVVAGPRLYIADGADGPRIRCLTLRTGTVHTLIACEAAVPGQPPPRHVDGPLSVACFSRSAGNMVVAPNGALILTDWWGGCIRRISAEAKTVGPSPSPSPSSSSSVVAVQVERRMTTLAGQPLGSHVEYARASAACFREMLFRPAQMALYVDKDAKARAPAIRTHSNAANTDAEADMDVGVLYVGCDEGVHVFDLDQGRRHLYPLSPRPGMYNVQVTGLALTGDGTRLFAGERNHCGLYSFDTRTGACTTLVQHPRNGFDLKTGAVTTDPKTTAKLSCASGLVIDKATRALVMVDIMNNRIVRVRGVDV
jgi:hypothetical protein